MGTAMSEKAITKREVAEERLLRTLNSVAKDILEKGMSKEEFQNKLASCPTKDAPQVVHDLVDALWDFCVSIFTKEK